MTPTVDERLASVIRALTDVIAPSLPKDSGLAQEQIQMCIGHLSILRSQIDRAPAFEIEEKNDAEALARALIAISGYGFMSKSASDALATLLASNLGDARATRIELNRGIAALISAAGEDGDKAVFASIQATVLKFEGARIQKDRLWFAPFGFDTIKA